MNLESLIAKFRTDADDAVEPYLFSDEAITHWLNEAEEEACIRANLLHESAETTVCEIDVTAGVMAYPVHPAIICITRAAFTPDGGTEEVELYLTDAYELDRTHAGWRKLVGTPTSLIHNDTHIRLGCKPANGGILQLEVQRLPLNPMVGEADEPEIAAIHHRHLVQWALFKGFSVPDSETHDPDRAQRAQSEFTRMFGLRPDADTRRGHQANVPHHTIASWLG